MRKATILLPTFALFAGLRSAGQTPPVAPKTPDTPVPPKIELPAPPAALPDVPNRPLSADEAAQIALRHQPNISVARAGIEAAQGRTQQTRSGLLPTLSIAAGYTNQQTIHAATAPGGGGFAGGIVSSAPGYQVSATVRQLVYDFNHLRDQVRQSAALERAATANLSRVEADLDLQTRQAFYTLQQNVRLVGVNEGNLRNQQDHLALAEARLKSGFGLPSDVVRARTSVAEAIQNLTVARANETLSRTSLALIMGIDPRTPVQVAETGEAPPESMDVNALVLAARKQRPELRQAEANLRAAEYGARSARSTGAPILSANLNLSSRGSEFPNGSDYFSIGFNLNWPLLDAGLTSGRVREARAGVESAQAQRTNTELAIVSDVAQSYISLRTAEQRVETGAAEVANAEEALRLAEGRYRAGLGQFIDVTDAQSALLTARANRVNAQSAVDQARAALAHATARPTAHPR